jgi:hypothetical protein
MGALSWNANSDAILDDGDEPGPQGEQHRMSAVLAQLGHHIQTLMQCSKHEG